MALLVAVTGGWIVVFNHIPALIAAVEVNSRAAPKKVADEILADAKARAPVLTGALRASGTTRSIEAGKSAEIEFGAPYAGYVEYGTYKMAAQPFLYPAVQAHEKQFVIEVGKPVFAGRVA